MQKEKQKKPEKQTYTVKIESLIPVLTVQRIVAETPEEAIELAMKRKGQQIEPPKIIYAKRGKSSVKVYRSNSTTVIMTKEIK